MFIYQRVYSRQKSHVVFINGHSRILNWRYQPYIRPIFQAYVREYPHKIWPYMVQYLHFRILEFPLTLWDLWATLRVPSSTRDAPGGTERNPPSGPHRNLPRPIWGNQCLGFDKKSERGILISGQIHLPPTRLIIPVIINISHYITYLGKL